MALAAHSFQVGPAPDDISLGVNAYFFKLLKSYQGVEKGQRIGGRPRWGWPPRGLPPWEKGCSSSVGVGKAESAPGQQVPYNKAGIFAG